MKQLNFRKLLDVYRESIETDAFNHNGDLPTGVRIITAEQDLLDYMRDFFAIEGSFLALWETDERYVCAVRVEPYNDGYLISGLETSPNQRRRGYAKLLIRAVVRCLNCDTAVRIYSHVKKNNAPSLQLHLSSGFSVILKHAVMLDGSVFADYYTLCYYKE